MCKNSSNRHRDFKVPSEVRQICNTLTRGGERGYVVGGSLRDMIGGHSVQDWDLATTATPQRVLELFDRVVPTGIAHGTVTVLLGNKGFEVTTLRGEGSYSDHRRPDQVVFLREIEEDLARRDFTINAMAWDPESGEIHDPFQGRVDLAAGVLRAVGDPGLRFAEDGLRVLRAARFAATLGFTVEEQTLRGIEANCHLLARVSAERKRDELAKLVSAPVPSPGLWLMARTGLLAHSAPDLQRLAQPLGAGGEAAIWSRVVARVDAVTGELHLRLAALSCDLGKPLDAAQGSAGQPGFAGDAGRAGALTGDWLRGLRFEKRLVAKVCHLVTQHGFVYSSLWTDTDVRRFLRGIGRSAVRDLFALRRAELETGDAQPSAAGLIAELETRVGQVERSAPALEVEELALGGRELIGELGIAPGPPLGELLSALLEHVLERPEDNTRDQLLQEARKISGLLGA